MHFTKVPNTDLHFKHQHTRSNDKTSCSHATIPFCNLWYIHKCIVEIQFTYFLLFTSGGHFKFVSCMGVLCLWHSLYSFQAPLGWLIVHAILDCTLFWKCSSQNSSEIKWDTPDKYLWLKLLCLWWKGEADALAISWNEGSITMLLGGEGSLIISWTKSKAMPPCWDCNRGSN